MIEKNETILNMLNNIIEKCNVIKNDFNENDETHCDYIDEKLSSAKWDLDRLVNLAHQQQEELKEKNNE